MRRLVAAYDRIRRDLLRTGFSTLVAYRKEVLLAVVFTIITTSTGRIASRKKIITTTNQVVVF